MENFIYILLGIKQTPFGSRSWYTNLFRERKTARESEKKIMRIEEKDCQLRAETSVVVLSRKLIHENRVLSRNHFFFANVLYIHKNNSQKNTDSFLEINVKRKKIKNIFFVKFARSRKKNIFIPYQFIYLTDMIESI